MSLTEGQIKSLKVKDKAYKITDSNGLFIRVFPSGKKTWQFRYFITKKEYTMSLGEYPILSLKEAREKVFTLRSDILHGKNPKEEAILEERSTLFKDVSLEWLNKQANIWSKGYTKSMFGLFERRIFPNLGNKDVQSILPKDVLEILRKCEDEQKYETAIKIMESCSQVFRYAVASSLCLSDPCRDLKGALTPHKNKPHAAILEPKAIGEFMRRIRGYKWPIMRNLLLFSAYTFCRPTEIREATWDEIDFEKKEWRIPPERMKMRFEHRVPLSEQCLKILQEQQGLSTKYIFPSKVTGKAISHDLARRTIHSLGYSKEEMCPHGFRAMASTLLNENGYNPDVIEKCLAHESKNKVRAVYNRAQYMEERKTLMQDYADLLDKLAKES